MERFDLRQLNNAQIKEKCRKTYQTGMKFVKTWLMMWMFKRACENISKNIKI
jgi:hypothetical protein